MRKSVLPITSAPISPERRQALIKLSACSLAPLFSADVFATTIHALPRSALVIGNSAYPSAPLQNPVNDANAIAAELKRLNFNISLQTNISRDGMEKAVRNYSSSLAKERGIGLFYFAGHGLQLDWRNFLVPVDAQLGKAEDVPHQAFDLAHLLESIGKSGNPMNIVVLDACRDNPFASERKTGKGLSQTDAPIGTLLAYATAPGNVASDGTGSNGLYTENLLREMTTPSAKIEDIFKRVRLAVRRSSQGQQIPWESTSLEEDFYFIPPTDLHKHSQEVLDQLFAQEQMQWETAKTAASPESIGNYLRNYPSGRFSELAQALLDRLLSKQGEKKIHIANSAKNPYTKGTASGGGFRVGDRFEYRIVDELTQIETQRFTATVTAITDSEVIFDNGQVVTNLLGSLRKLPNGRRFGDSQIFAAEYSLGKTWQTRFDTFYPDGSSASIEREFRVTAYESITVPAGTFDAYRVESKGWVMQKGVQINATYWIAPELCPRFLVQAESNRNRRGALVDTNRTELVAFTRGQG